MTNEWGDLELFTNANARVSEPIISITPKGMINLGAGFLVRAQKQLENCSFVELFYSKSKDAVVMKFTDKQRPNCGLKLSKKTDVGSTSISSISFLKYYDIHRQGRYLATQEEIPNLGLVWVVYFSNKINVGNIKN